MSRRWWAACAAMTVAGVPFPIWAQDADGPPEQIDILIPQEDYDRPLEDCSDEQEAALISGEIIVCRRRRDQREFGYDTERAQQRYAAETMDKGDPRAPDFGESCKKNPEKGPCIGFGSVPPPAYIVDFTTLPETPPGSDADRIGRGLAPLGNTSATSPPPSKAELGLPPAPAEEDGEALSPSESASPTAEPSG